MRDDIEMDLNGMNSENVNWSKLTQHRLTERAFVVTVMNLWVP
jgi:hypothetical protein